MKKKACRESSRPSEIGSDLGDHSWSVRGCSGSLRGLSPTANVGVNFHVHWNELRSCFRVMYPVGSTTPIAATQEGEDLDKP